MLAQSLNCAVNVPIRLVQSVAAAITNLQSPNLNATTLELQCFIIAGGSWIEDVVLYVLNLLGMTAHVPD